MKKNIVGVLIHEAGEPAIKTDDGKVKLVYNIFDGFSGKHVKITIQEVKKKEKNNKE